MAAKKKRKKTGPQPTADERCDLLEHSAQQFENRIEQLELDNEKLETALSYIVATFVSFSSEQSEKWDNLASELEDLLKGS